MTSGWRQRRDIFSESYQEVLTALKHQDDKLNRTLTAIAFLTAAGVALFANVGKHVDTTFDGTSLPVTDALFLLFLIGIALALLTTLVAIGPSTALRWTPRSTGEQSLIFYARIAQDEDWRKNVGSADERLEERLARNYLDEAEVLSHRVEYKIGRSREAGAFLQLVVVCLALLGIYSINELSSLTRWRLAASLVFAIAALPLWDFLLMRLFRFSNNVQWDDAYNALLASLGLSGILLVRGAPWEAQWVALGYSLGVIFSVRMSFVHDVVARVALPLLTFVGVVLVLLEILH